MLTLSQTNKYLKEIQDGFICNQCSCNRGHAKSCDILGDRIGFISGNRSRRTINIVPLRGKPADLSPKRLSKSCPVHSCRLEDTKTEKRHPSMGDNGTNLTYKQIIQRWHQAVQCAKSEKWLDAFNTLLDIQNYSAKMSFNLGQVAYMLDKLDLAVENLTAATEKDPHMALAHFQLGMVNYRLHRYNESRSSYDKAKTCLRGNKFIDYRQLGFVHKLYECEILYNLALTYATMMSNSEFALELLEEARKVAVEARHGPLIEKAQNCLLSNQLYDPFLLPSNQLFRPPASKVDGLKNVNYLGKAKVISELPQSGNNNNDAAPKKGIPPVPLPNSFQVIDDDFSDDEDFPLPNGGGGGGSTSPTPSTVARMTHKDTIAAWYEGVLAQEKGDAAGALNLLYDITDPSSKILYDIGILQKSMGQLEEACSTFKEVVSKDPHLAIGHFQLGVVLGMLGRHNDAWESFNTANETLRGTRIDYKQLGLQYKLHKCEILHNQAWTYHELDQTEWAQRLLQEATECKAEPRHDKMDESYRKFSNGQSFQLYDLPKVLLFKPPKSKIDNLARKDYLGKAKIVAKLPTVRRSGASTPPPVSSNSLTVSALPPRSRTPTPSSGPPSAPPPLGKNPRSSSPALPSRPVPSFPTRPSLPDTGAAPWKRPVVTVESLQASRPPARPLPGKALPPAPDVGGRTSSGLPPSRPLPSATNTSPLPGRKMSGDAPPSRPLPSPTNSSPLPGRKMSSDAPPSRPLPSPTNSSPLPGRKMSSDAPPNRPLPSVSRTSPVPQRPVPPQPSRTLSTDLPPSKQLPVPLPNCASSVPDRPLPKRDEDMPPSKPLPVPNRESPPPERSVPPPPKKTSGLDLPQRPLPAAPKTSSSDIPNRPLPSSPRLDRSPFANRPVPPPPDDDEIDFPSRPAPPAPRSSTIELLNRPVPQSPNFNRKLPDPPGQTSSKSSSSDLSYRPVPALPSDGPPDDLPSRPVPLPPRPGLSSSLSSSPDLPSRPLPGPPRDNFSSRSVPPPPVPKSSEPELPPRPVPKSKTPLPERPVPSTPPSSSSHLDKKTLNQGRRSSSPGLPDLPPPPPPKKMPSPKPPRKEFATPHTGSNDLPKTGAHKAKLVKIESDSPPVLRRAAAVTVVQVAKEEKPSLPARPSTNNSNNKPPFADKKPPVLAFKPEVKSHGGVGGGGKRKKTALVIAAHESTNDGEVSVAEGDLVTVIKEEGSWLQVEAMGHKGRLPKACLKDFNKPDLNL